MKLNVETTIKDIEGNAIDTAGTTEQILAALNSDEPAAQVVQRLLKLVAVDRKPMTLRTEAVKVLLITEQDEDAVQKFDRARLAEKLMGGPVVDLDVDEAALIRARIGKFCSSIVVMRCWDLIDNPVK